MISPALQQQPVPAPTSHADGVFHRHPDAIDVHDDQLVLRWLTSPAPGSW
jgi:hypothetical protein